MPASAFAVLLMRPYPLPDCARLASLIWVWVTPPKFDHANDWRFTSSTSTTTLGVDSSTCAVMPVWFALAIVRL